MNFPLRKLHPSDSSSTDSPATLEFHEGTQKHFLSSSSHNSNRINEFIADDMKRLQISHKTSV